MEKKLVFGNALHMAGDGTIAGIKKMQELSAQVSLHITSGHNYE